MPPPDWAWRRPSSGNWKRQMLAGSKETHVTKTPGEKPPTAGEGKTSVEPSTPAAMPPTAGPRDAAGLADAVAALEKRLAETRTRLDGLDADVERQRREKREPDIEIAIRKGVLELLGKEPGADPENLTGREKAVLVKQTSERLGVTAGSLLPVVGIARSTYHYQLNAMKRPDKDSGLLELVREAFENSKRRYGYKRVHLELKGMGVRVSAKRVMRLTARHGLAPLFKSAKRYGSYKGEPAKAPKNLADRDFHAERSMSAKGCSPDNAAAEEFFGRLKQEFFHKRSFAGVASRIPFGPTGKHCSLFNDRKFFEFHWLSLALSMSQTRFVRSVLLGFTVVFLAIFPLPHRAASCRAARRFSPLV